MLTLLDECIKQIHNSNFSYPHYLNRTSLVHHVGYNIPKDLIKVRKGFTSDKGLYGKQYYFLIGVSKSTDCADIIVVNHHIDECN